MFQLGYSSFAVRLARLDKPLPRREVQSVAMFTRYSTTHDKRRDGEHPGGGKITAAVLGSFMLIEPAGSVVGMTFHQLAVILADVSVKNVYFLLDNAVPPPRSKGFHPRHSSLGIMVRSIPNPPEQILKKIIKTSKEIEKVVDNLV